MNALEVQVKDYIRERTYDNGHLSIPLVEMAQDLDSSTATVWRVVKRLEEKRVIKVIKPKQKTMPNTIFYLGEEDELNSLIDSIMMKTGGLLVLIKELKTKVKEKDDVIFNLMHEKNG